MGSSSNSMSLYWVEDNFVSSKSIGWITLNVLGKISTRSILISLWDIRIKKKKKKFPTGSTTCSLRHYYGSLACPFSFLGLGVEVLFTSLRCGPMVLVLILGVGLKFETQPQVTMWHRSAQELYLPTTKMTRSLGDRAMALTTWGSTHSSLII